MHQRIGIEPPVFRPGQIMLPESHNLSALDTRDVVHNIHVRPTDWSREKPGAWSLSGEICVRVAPVLEGAVSSGAYKWFDHSKRLYCSAIGRRRRYCGCVISQDQAGAWPMHMSSACDSSATRLTESKRGTLPTQESNLY